MNTTFRRDISYIFTVQFRDISVDRTRELLFAQSYYVALDARGSSTSRIRSILCNRFPRNDSLIFQLSKKLTDPIILSDRYRIPSMIQLTRNRRREAYHFLIYKKTKSLVDVKG